MRQTSLAPEQAPHPRPADPDRDWIEHVYQRGARQLTGRAVIAGMLIGGLMGMTNLYVSLKLGWSFGVTIIASTLAFAIFNGLHRLQLVRDELTLLENNAISSVASGAGYMSGGGNLASISALLLLTGFLPASGWLIAWFTVMAALGVLAAIPLKRQFINLEALPFPSGTATAETLRVLHGGGQAARSRARLFGFSALVGSVVSFWRDANHSWVSFNLPGRMGLPFTIGGRSAAAWTLSFDFSLLLLGAGALMSFKTGWSMLLGALLSYGLLLPELEARGILPEVGYRSFNAWLLWPGTALLVSSGLLSFAVQWRSVARSFTAFAGLFKHRDLLAGIECPPKWFLMGFAGLGPVAIGLMAYLFQIPWWMGGLSLLLAMLMGVIAARVTGETDTTPTKALGSATQLVYGGLLPGNLTANVMGANVTAGVGLHAADLLTDLKSGWVLGANPRQQFFAQLFGILSGAVVVVLTFNLLVPSAEALGTSDLPAPTALVWAGVSKMLSSGLGAVPDSARVAAMWGALLGAALVLLERWVPAGAKPFIPSAASVGLALLVPASSSISLFIGAAFAEALRRRRPKVAEATVVPVGSGFVAGESLMGTLIVLLKALGVMPR